MTEFIQKSQKVLLSRSLNCLKSRLKFEKATGFSHTKVEEVIAVLVTNQWFKSEGIDLKISLSTKPRGADGELQGKTYSDFDRVEVKSSKDSNKQFQFSRNFTFSTHGCVICLEKTNE